MNWQTILAGVVALGAVAWAVLTKLRARSAAGASVADLKKAEAVEKKAKDAATEVLTKAEAEAEKVNREAAEAIARPESSEDWSRRMGARDKP